LQGNTRNFYARDKKKKELKNLLVKMLFFSACSIYKTKKRMEHDEHKAAKL
jgi:hypothetical protein